MTLYGLMLIIQAFIKGLQVAYVFRKKAVFTVFILISVFLILMISNTSIIAIVSRMPQVQTMVLVITPLN